MREKRERERIRKETRRRQDCTWSRHLTSDVPGVHFFSPFFFEKGEEGTNNVLKCGDVEEIQSEVRGDELDILTVSSKLLGAS